MRIRVQCMRASLASTVMVGLGPPPEINPILLSTCMCPLEDLGREGESASEGEKSWGRPIQCMRASLYG